MKRIKRFLRKREGAHDDVMCRASNVQEAAYVEVDRWQRNLITTILSVSMLGL